MDKNSPMMKVLSESGLLKTFFGKLSIPIDCSMKRLGEKVALCWIVSTILEVAKLLLKRLT